MNINSNFWFYKKRVCEEQSYFKSATVSSCHINLTKSGRLYTEQATTGVICVFLVCPPSSQGIVQCLIHIIKHAYHLQQFLRKELPRSGIKQWNLSKHIEINKMKWPCWKLFPYFSTCNAAVAFCWFIKTCFLLFLVQQVFFFLYLFQVLRSPFL